MKILKIATAFLALLAAGGLSGCIAIEAHKEADVQGLTQRIEALEQTVVRQQAEISKLQSEAAKPADTSASGQKP